MRFLLLYSVLVGLPLLGVLAILRAGERLVPPVSVQGTWQLESGFPSDPAGGCLVTGSETDRPKLDVSQSGPRLEVTVAGLNEIHLQGTVEDGVVTLESGTEARNVGHEPVDLSLRAVLDVGTDPERLVGWVDAGCGQQGFRASRLDASQGSR